MSFAIRLKARYAFAKAQFLAAEGAVQAKAEKMLVVVGDKKPPITHASLQDGWERLLKVGVPEAEVKRLMQVTYRPGFETLINDEAAYSAKLRDVKADIEQLRGELGRPEVIEQIEKSIPKELREKLSEKQLKLVVAEVVTYAAEICRFIEAVLTKALHGAHWPAARAVGFAQAQAAVEAFFAMHATITAPLKNLEP